MNVHQDIINLHKKRTTVDLPDNIVSRIKYLVRSGFAKNQKSLIIAAIEKYLQEIENLTIDSQFAEMQNDVRYRKLNLKISKEYDNVSNEAWMI